MIRLKSGNNNVAITLTENTTLTNANYLFEFINNQTQTKHYCISPDTSLYPNRYNLFDLVVVGLNETADALNGELNLLQGDEFTYNIYQQDSDTNLDPLNATSKVETGMMTYDRNIETREDYSTSETTRKSYEPNL